MLTALTACRPISEVPRFSSGDDNNAVSTTPGDNVQPAETGGENNSDDGQTSTQTPASRAFSGMFAAPSFNSPDAINAPYGALYDLSGDVFIYGKNVDERVYPSGAVKLLTALTVYDALSPSFIFTVGGEIDMVGRDSGVAGLSAGQTLSMETMLAALLIPVGNDAAYTISVNAARELNPEISDTRSDNELNDYFLRLMNDYADKLGCTFSNFSNPDGFHASDNYSTVRDLTLIAAAAASNPTIAEICGKTEHSAAFVSGGAANWNNSNTFLALENWDIRGLRAGYTDESGFSAQILAYINGKAYIAVVSGSPTAADRQSDVIKLLQMARDGHNAGIIEAFET